MGRPNTNIAELFPRQIDSGYVSLIQDERNLLDERAKILSKTLLGGLDAQVGVSWSLERDHADVDAILARLYGKKVLELGCGPELDAFHEELANLELELYVGVDPAFNASRRTGGTLPGLGSYFNLSTAAGDSLNGFAIQTDMLSALASAPDGDQQEVFNAVVINGVDIIVRGRKISEDPYAQAVMDEIARVLPVGGLVIGASFEHGILQALPEHTGNRLQPTLEREVHINGTTFTSLAKKW